MVRDVLSWSGEGRAVKRENVSCFNSLLLCNKWPQNSLIRTTIRGCFSLSCGLTGLSQVVLLLHMMLPGATDKAAFSESSTQDGLSSSRGLNHSILVLNSGWTQDGVLNHSILVLNSGWTQEGKDRTASSWGRGLELARCHFHHILLIKASHSPAQLKGRENRSQLYMDVAVCRHRDGAMVAVLLQASYAREDKGCSVSWLTKAPGNTWNAASEARVCLEGKQSCQRLLRRQLSWNMIYWGYHQ